MRVLFSNPPWWEGIETVWRKKILPVKRYRHGVRAGSRWPFTFLGRSKPDNFVSGDYLPYPFFMGYAATYVREKTGHEVVMRDSIALNSLCLHLTFGAARLSVAGFRITTHA